VKTTARIALAGFGLFCVVATGLYLAGYRVNTTESYPIGIYKIEEGYTKGDLVFLCPEGKDFEKLNARGYIPKGLCPAGTKPLLKKAMAVAGDRVVVSDYVYINGKKVKNSKLYLYDSKGNRIKFFDQKSYYLGPGQVFVLSDYNDKSFDSRYFGPINQNSIIGKAVPVFLIGSTRFYAGSTMH